VFRFKLHPSGPHLTAPQETCRRMLSQQLFPSQIGVQQWYTAHHSPTGTAAAFFTQKGRVKNQSRKKHQTQVRAPPQFQDLNRGGRSKHMLGARRGKKGIVVREKKLLTLCLGGAQQRLDNYAPGPIPSETETRERKKYPLVTQAAPMAARDSEGHRHRNSRFQRKEGKGPLDGRYSRQATRNGVTLGRGSLFFSRSGADKVGHRLRHKKRHQYLDGADVSSRGVLLRREFLTKKSGSPKLRHAGVHNRFRGGQVIPRGEERY